MKPVPQLSSPGRPLFGQVFPIAARPSNDALGSAPGLSALTAGALLGSHTVTVTRPALYTLQAPASGVHALSLETWGV